MTAKPHYRLAYSRRTERTMWRYSPLRGWEIFPDLSIIYNNRSGQVYQRVRRTQ